MRIRFKTYKYSGAATAVSVFSAIISLFCTIFGIAMLISFNIIGFIILLAIVIVLNWFFIEDIPDKIAKKDLVSKLKKRPKFACKFCNENPGTFEAIAAENPKFAEIYCLNEEGKVVKRK